MDKLPNAEYWNVTHVTETSDVKYAEKLLGVGWKLIVAGMRCSESDSIPILVLGWAKNSEPVYPQSDPLYQHLGQSRK